jgi:amiloride-sensitive sodium channel
MFRLDKMANQTVDDKNDQLEWTLENGYIESHEENSVPAKAQKSFFLSANVLLRENDTSNLCTAIGSTFSYYLHLPIEIMMVNWHQEQQVEFQKKKDLILSAKSYTADKGMKKFTPEARGCYFEGEKKLKFFKTYTKALCEFECMTNYTLKTCGCVKFSMPRTSFTPICDVNETDCLNDAMQLWPNFEMIKDKYEATCRCLKPCNDIKYFLKYTKSSAIENVSSVYYINNLTKGYENAHDSQY